MGLANGRAENSGFFGNSLAERLFGYGEKVFRGHDEAAQNIDDYEVDLGSYCLVVLYVSLFIVYNYFKA